ncbi:unnamed protein product [Polarella glacialis]|uniref:Uncharacterized protein n=1 Tax=Polarella glacialis TaxID=89957 RepID=A0A813JCY9_POLGL|nr:unnamed protein product [Polarella glacialis]|eukprot:CAMPEP_0115060696 /NCGR_PEP_ID=MMETSP0227-20121206/7600_1 /TAXON_ID=89957 /ORGANISM="Polarella glacialis, Strain CCMP 1383" /LENGTH=249 /DNA_ID=CAMNT_0002445925 /DNA_START=64 /DNA_END=813 /DNA_ORIENTATION=-
MATAPSRLPEPARELGSKGGSSIVLHSDSEAGSEDDGDDIERHRFTAEETLLIFDWDDTVMPSSWVLEEGLRIDESCSPTMKQQEHLTELARLAARTLKLAQKLGTVLLVTNAERGWVELSCQKFMPSLVPLLDNVRTLSARTEYESADLPSPFEWKLKAFQNEIRRFFDLDIGTVRRKNVLSFGDSGHEREAVIHATANLSDCRTKSLKFIDRPGVDDLRKQHACMVKCLRQIVHHDGNLDLCIRLAD